MKGKEQRREGRLGNVEAGGFFLCMTRFLFNMPLGKGRKERKDGKEGRRSEERRENRELNRRKRKSEEAKSGREQTKGDRHC